MIDVFTIDGVPYRMLAQQRQQLILNALSRSPFVALHDVVEITGASPATVRRDFAALEKQGNVHRHRGGVERRGGGVEDNSTQKLDSKPLISLSLESRMAVCEQAKQLIADQASIFCREGQTVFLDAGSTALCLAGHLGDMPLRVITNSFAAARAMFDRGRAEIVLVGGQIDHSSQVVYSYVDTGIIESYPPDIAFLGAQGIDSAGYYNSDERLIRLERHVARVATQTVLMCDSSKFGLRGQVRIGRLNELDIIVTDAGLPGEHEREITDAGIRLVKVR